jgi:hypothetical protein
MLSLVVSLSTFPHALHYFFIPQMFCLSALYFISLIHTFDIKNLILINQPISQFPVAILLVSCSDIVIC